MKVIGITGGVGSGKSEILAYIQKRADCDVIIADRVAHDLEKRGGICYERIVALLGTEIVAGDGEIDRAKMAAIIFADAELLNKINDIVHPAVKEYIVRAIASERQNSRINYLFIEAALLIEGGYKEIVDELWYIHTDESVRRERLKKSRGYTEDKIDRIMNEQLSEEEFYRHCSVVIDNSRLLADTCRQIDEKLGDELCQKR